MTHARRFTFIVKLAAVALTLSLRAVAQVPAPSAADAISSPETRHIPALTVADVEAALTAVEEDPNLEEPMRDLLRSKYQNAIAVLKDAAIHVEKEAEYRDAMTKAPVMTTELRKKLQELRFNEK